MQTTTMPPPPPTPSNKPDHPLPSEINPSESKENKLPDEQSDTVEVADEGRESEGKAEGDSSSGRERLKRHRVEVAGRVWIPDMWGQEDFLKDWIDCAAFDASLVNSSIVLARDSLMGERRRPPNSAALRIHNGCN